MSTAVRPWMLRALRALRGPSAGPARVIEFLPSDVPIEEEKLDSYVPEHYSPVLPGEVFNRRYRTITKLGYGAESTVLLARDTKQWWWQCPYSVLKIGLSSYKDTKAARHELESSRRLRKNSSHAGFGLVRHVLDDFEIAGPAGSHVCLVFEPLREPLDILTQRFKGGRFPLLFVKLLIRLLLEGLDYTHSECQIIHTDLKLENILVAFEDPAVIEKYVQTQVGDPMPRKLRNDRLLFISHNKFQHPENGNFPIHPKITDFSHARVEDGSDTPRIAPIQANAYRAPEVILGTGWSYSTDIWNFGVVLWNMIGPDLFQHTQVSGGHAAKAHLAETIALLGPPPKQLIERENEMTKWHWTRKRRNVAGELCVNVREYFEGPFFDESGEFIYPDLIPTDRSPESTVPMLEGEDERLFLEFARKMLQWQPEDRKTAKELLGEPWLEQGFTEEGGGQAE